MNKRLAVNKLLPIAFLSLLFNIGCASQPDKGGMAGSASKASPEAMTAIQNASDAIAEAKANDWIWRDTESYLKEARQAAQQGDNATAIKLADKAKFEAESAVIQYNYEKNHPRSL